MMRRRRWSRKSVNRAISYLVLVVVGMVMVYPLVFMFFGTFKQTHELFGSTRLLPEKFDLSPYVEGWKGTGQYSYLQFFANTLAMVLPALFATLISCTLVAYGFARFTFPGKRILFTLMLSTLMLPSAVVTIPQFILFKNLSWVNTYLPFIIPSVFGGGAFFIFMSVQFFRGIPRELDEAACIDGCNSLQTLGFVLTPLLTPVLFSVGIFKFIWTWNDFFGPLIYINDVKKYTISLALKMSIDTTTGVQWNQVLAMSFLAIAPSILIFFFAQKYFVEGIATSGLKG